METWMHYRHEGGRRTFVGLEEMLGRSETMEEPGRRLRLAVLTGWVGTLTNRRALPRCCWAWRRSVCWSQKRFYYHPQKSLHFLKSLLCINQSRFTLYSALWLFFYLDKLCMARLYSWYWLPLCIHNQSNHQSLPVMQQGNVQLMP